LGDNHTEDSKKQNITIWEPIWFHAKLISYEAKHTLEIVLEFYWNKQGDLHMVLIVLERAYDRMLRQARWRHIKKKRLYI